MSAFAARLKTCGFRGDIREDLPTRLLNATDNSIYELLPQGVIQPFDENDLKILVAVANQPDFQALTFTARGGGTGTNGQSLTQGWIVDTSRYMTRILNFDLENQQITVEPGIVLSELNRFLKPQGLFFAPSVSTANRATIGGMIATDAAGKGSLKYGKTSDHLAAVDFVLINTDADISALKQNIADILKPLQAEIKQRFPALKRPLSGYNLQQGYHEGQVDLNRLLAGSEGTLAFISKARLKLLPLPSQKQLIIIQYPDFLAALKDTPFLLEYGPIAIEVVDDQVQRCVDGRSEVSNFIEFTEPDKVERLLAALSQRNSPYTLLTDPAEQAKIWAMRAAAVGLVARLPGTRKPIAFVEDAIVPPEYLCDFIAEFQALLQKHQLHYAMYGHADVGCIHVRPALDMKVPEDREKIRILSEGVFTLTQKYHGLLWGEHGKGFRSEFVPEVFGPELYAAMLKIKALFDPQQRLNPGKLVNPVALDAVPLRGEFDALIDQDLQQKYDKAMICNGNAACFNREPSNVMCPSYKVTNDRIHSPKGRAMLVKEWLRTQSKSAADDVLTAMNGCLGCKGCTGKCPVNVSIPDLRSNFLETYYQRYKRRPLRDYLMAGVEDILPLAARFSKLWNLAIRLKLMSVFGLSKLPLLPKRQTSIPYHHKLDTPLPEKAVVILADVFTSVLDASVLSATYNSLKTLGFEPYVLSPRASGKALVVTGFLNAFKRKAGKWATLLNPLFEANIPVIGLENTIVLLYRDEFQKFGNQTLKGNVLSLAEYFSSVMPAQAGIQPTATYQLLPHCTEQALLPTEAKNWQAIFNTRGLNLSIQNAGCCGMAGLYGYQTEHQQNSRQLFEMHWQPHLDPADHAVLATGFSCRSQALRFGNQKLQHPVEVLSNILSKL